MQLLETTPGELGHCVVRTLQYSTCTVIYSWNRRPRQDQQSAHCRPEPRNFIKHQGSHVCAGQVRVCSHSRLHSSLLRNGPDGNNNCYRLQFPCCLLPQPPSMILVIVNPSVIFRVPLELCFSSSHYLEAGDMRYVFQEQWQLFSRT